jgi:hypothetical protein
MSHFAQIDDNNIVINVIVAEQDFIDSGLVGDPSKWIQTSYNTHEGIHVDGKAPLRKNYASVGHTYDSVRDAFIPPCIYPSWVLDEDKCVYVPPKPYPSDGREYKWNEDVVDWVDLAGNRGTPVEII